jgi:16S rRNA processing protein RimM
MPPGQRRRTPRQRSGRSRLYSEPSVDLSPDDLIQIGIVTKPWGVRGEVKVRLTSDIPDRLAGLEGIWLFDGGTTIRYHAVKGIKQLNDAVALRLEGVDTREAAEEVRNWEVAVPEAERARLAEDEYYIYDLIGLRVEDREGTPLGELTRVWQGAAQDVFEIATADGPVLIPAVAAYVIEIDLAAGLMTVEVPRIEERRQEEDGEGA